jgi:GH24 family phage-related lysozyme (muramidase)
MTERFDEGVKEILLSLLSLGATAYEAGYIIDVLNKRPEPIEQKIEGLKQADKKLESPEFDYAAQRAIEILNNQKSQELTSEDYITTAVNLIIPSEIYGDDITATQNKRFLSPYKDDKGLWTIGIGHLMGDGSQRGRDNWIAKYGNSLTPSQATSLFRRDLEKRVETVQKIVTPKVFNNLSSDRKAVLIDIAYRGDLKKGFKFVEYIKRGDFNNAAIAYLDHSEYKARKSKGVEDGVVKRMNRNASILRGSV